MPSGEVNGGMMSPHDPVGFSGSKTGPVWSPWPLRYWLPTSSTLEVFTEFTV